MMKMIKEDDEDEEFDEDFNFCNWKKEDHAS